MTARQSYHLTFARFSPSLSVKSFTASEAANTAYRVEITATSTDSSLPLSSYLNQRAAFEIRLQEAVLSEVAAAFAAGSDESPAKQWQGIVTSCEKLSVSKDETVYRFVLEPRFAALKHFQSSRLFQNQTVPDIVAAVFKHHGFSGVDYRFQKSRSYTVREYVTQYLESDFAFINRLCEEEGIWYAFEQHEQHGDVVVFGDSPEHYFRDQSLPVSYRPHAGLESVGTEALFNLSIRHNPIVEGIRSADYNYRTADTDLFAETDNKQSEESADNTVLLGKQQNWGLHPKTPNEAKVQTTLLNEAVLCRQTVANGSGNVVSMAPMKVFQTDTAFPEAPDGWLVLSMEHSGSRDTAYSHTFTAIPAQLTFRPERTTPRPHIAGTLPARVTAAENCTYAYIDDMGRYRVKLPFDLDEWSPGGESRPVRLAKPYAGPEYGIHFPLHEGTEVMLSFVQGNPDRPYISGVMHDSAHPDHIPADWNTRNVIRTWANNKLRMEDQKGQEHIKLATDYQKSQLNLGHIVDSSREKRGENGEGFELRTDGWGAVRAGKGILVSAQNQDANGKVLDMDDAIAQLEQALSLAKSLNKAAQTANNHHTDEETQRGRLKDALKDLKEAGLIQTAPAGIATATQQSQLHTANENIHLISGNHTDITAGQSLTAHAVESLNLFAQSSGIKVQANQGKVEVQAQNDELQLNALKDAMLTSSAGKITIAAKEEILITCKGAYIKLANGEVEIGSPKLVRVKAPMEVSGVKGINYPLQNIPPLQIFSNKLDLYDIFGFSEEKIPFTVIGNKDRESQHGTLDKMGRTDRLYSDTAETVKIFAGNAALLPGEESEEKIMAQYRFEFLDADRKPIAKCHYQIMRYDSTLRKDVADENGRAAFESELITGKKIWVRFWAQGQRQDAAFSTQPFYWAENVITQPIMAPRIYEIELRETENKNNEPEDYRQAFYEVQAGDTWEGIAEKFGTQKIFIYEDSCSDGDNPIVGAKLLLPHGCKR